MILLFFILKNEASYVDKSFLKFFLPTPSPEYDANPIFYLG